MRIYLDSCILQDLKNESNKDLLSSIIQSKGELIYCFSEAHLYDLSRDKTDEKFADMIFMERIVDDNCYYYDKRILFNNCTPAEYYNRFDWSSVTSANEFITSFSDGDIFGNLFKSVLSIIPLNFENLISENQLPEDMPQDLVDMLLKPSNMYEFMLTMTYFSDTLSAEQKKIKELLQFLHKNHLTESIFKQIGIEGYDGKIITDKEKFINSYSNYYLKNTNGKGKNRYNLFIDMYNGLEFFGFVQGKFKKQKMNTHTQI